MFKRSNKITSLLVAAAAVVSLVPASAADIKKIDSEDGIIYNAVAYADGKAYVDGEINDDEAAYYVKNGDFSELEDVDSGDDVALFGEKYLDIDDGDYTVDLDSGEVNDDDIVEDTIDDAAADLRKDIKDDTDDRYDEDEADDIKDSDDDTIDIIPGGKYDTAWFSTTYKAADDAIKDKVNDLNSKADADQFFNVFFDEDGEYIDADYNLGKIKVTTTAPSASNASDVVDKKETIENTNDTYDAAGTDGDDKLSASVQQDKVLAQDEDYIYRLATIKVAVTTGSAAKISEINGMELYPDKVGDTPEIFKPSNNGQTVSFKAIQKISKEADSDDIDGANYAKNVTTYALSDDDGMDLDGEKLFDDSNIDDTKFTVANGKLIAYNTKIDDDDNVIVRAYTLKSSSGYYYADEEDESKEDCEFNDDDGNGAAVDVDVDGNLWRLDGGYIYKFDNTDDWDKVYKVDGSLDELSVYDEDNIIAWCEDDEVYSIISGRSSDEDTNDNTNPNITTGWVQAADATWSYNNADGTKATGWLNDGGTWYYLNYYGTMATGWLNDNGTWYYLNGSGAMATGWLNDNGTWYYLNGSGTMATGWLNDNGTWYHLNGSGAMTTGWLNDNGTWYYLNGSGSMLSNTTVDGYKLGASGAWIK